MFLLLKKQLISFLMINLLQQIKNRRLALKLKQNDMPMRIGISRQQYQRLEAKGNPRLDTLELIAKGLNSDVMLIPKEKLSAVLAALESDGSNTSLPHKQPDHSAEQKKLSDDPWKGLLEDGDEDDNGN
ncbi:helix-turn-helix transcriptional regulator [Marinomonas algarum]|uniref:Helix-turn-helix domain-containing protein n=1 Tax=Marinomonas algarum TaxID=2883105 RepID=A0A9X1LFU2_9GAMM|nr:helix-turn-helix transcriptional regulator [Marinomonas algarum]MCB5163198.1 helix-turn-helix domain-containing protein [Marinomonas algarum]